MQQVNLITFCINQKKKKKSNNFPKIEKDSK